MYNVYLLCSYVGEDKLYKIGYTRRRVEQRIKDFKTGNCSEIDIIEVFSSKWGTKIESQLHRRYKSEQKNISGEWFYLTDNDVLSFKENCENIHNNIELMVNENTYYIEKNKF